jgi:hypothetical protein
MVEVPILIVGEQGAVARLEDGEQRGFFFPDMDNGLGVEGGAEDFKDFHWCVCVCV